MTRYGTNMKLTLSEDVREQTRTLYTEVFAAKLLTPMPDLDVFLLDDGFHLGVYFVPPSDALSVEDAGKGAWLELIVDNVQVTTAKLNDVGIKPMDYHDKAHSYFKAPGGTVFRLAAAK